MVSSAMSAFAGRVSLVIAQHPFSPRAARGALCHCAANHFFGFRSVSRMWRAEPAARSFTPVCRPAGGAHREPARRAIAAVLSLAANAVSDGAGLLIVG